MDNYEEMILTWLTIEQNQKIQDEKSSLEDRLSKLEDELNGYKDTHSADNEEVESLRGFKNERLALDRTNSIDAIFSAFDEKLTGIEDYDNLKENCSELEIQAIEDKCFAIVGKKDFKFSAISKKPIEVVKIPIASPKEEYVEPYGGIHSKFGIKTNKE
jgi:vacuolar-type H+-ATPase subunit E/Vma4